MRSPFRNAREALAALVQRYAELRSYADEGFVRPLGLGALKAVWFDTLFKKPEQFRFEFARPHPYFPLRHRVTTCVVGTSGQGPYFSRRTPGHGHVVQPVESVGMAVSMATGVSQGAAHTIGRLVLPSACGLSLRELKRPRLLKGRRCRRTLCTVISAWHPSGGGCITLSFGKEDLLLRRVVWHFPKSEEVRFNIRANIPLSQASFKAPVGTELAASP